MLQKKLLCAGNRGAKDQGKDIQEAIDTLERYKEIQTIKLEKENPIKEAVLDARHPNDILVKQDKERFSKYSGC